jgi:hypothetical protein
MPFRPDLNYFFLFLKEYLEKKYPIRVERGDSKVLTIELLKKISDQISEASFIIADITGENANVFFELGIAHERNKPVILISQGNPKDAPVDIRPFESIQYDLGKHDDFLAKLSNAALNVLGASLNIPQLYDLARDLLRRFNADSGFSHGQVSRDEFHARVVRAAETPGIPSMDEIFLLDSFLLLKILDVADPALIRRAMLWLDTRGSRPT